MFSKLDRIHKKPNNEIINKLKPAFEFKQKLKDGGLTKIQKSEIKATNNYFYKKLNKQTSCYNFEKLNKEFEQSQYFKKNICEFPCIDFHKTKQNFMGRKSSNYDNTIPNNGSVFNANSIHESEYSDAQSNIQGNEEKDDNKILMDKID